MATQKKEAQRIQETCLALRPLIGEQADQLWKLYIAEDYDGKLEVAELVDLLAQSRLSGSVDERTPVFHPPSAAQASGDIPLGKVFFNGQKSHTFALKESELFQHQAILGRSGSGKTNLGFQFVSRLRERDVPFILLDWKRNYRDLLALPGFEKLRVYTVGRDLAPFRFNPLIPPPTVTPASYLQHLVEIIGAAYFLGDGCHYLLVKVIDELYREFGVYDGSVSEGCYPTFKDVLQRLKKLPAKGREMLWLSSALRAISSLCFGQIDSVVNTAPNETLDGILTQNIVFEMETLGQAEKIFFTQSIMHWIHMHKLSGDQPREQLSSMIIIEEAHHVLNKNARKTSASGEGVMDVIFKQLREFGIGICLMDQSGSELSLASMSNTFCTVTLNCKSKADVAAMASAMLLNEEQKESLGRLEVGKAVVKLQGRVTEPFMLAIEKMEIEKGSVSDEKLRKISKQYIKPSVTKSGARLSQEGKALLRDIAVLPESGVAARYKRLGVSVRQGDELKKQLIEHRLVEQSMQKTSSGQKMTLRLTEDGKTVVQGTSRESRG